MKLTKSVVDGLTCPPDKFDVLVFDSELRWFAVRVTKAGTKVFLYQYKRGKRVRRLILGRSDEITPAQARKLAEIARGREQAGGDPVAERKGEIAAEEAEMQALRERRKVDALTLDRLIDEWDRKHLAHQKPRYRLEAVSRIRSSLPALLTMPAHAIDTKTLRQALDKLASEGRPTTDAPPVLALKKRGKGVSPRPAKPIPDTARRVRAYGHALFNWAVDQELVAENPFARIKLGGGVKERERYLSDAEIGEVWRAAERMGWPWGPFFRVLMLTLQRKSEVAGMAWAELAPDRTTWELPGSRVKNGKAHVVHLAEPAREILQAVPRILDSPLVFTKTGREPVSGFSVAVRRLNARIMGERTKLAAAAGREPAPFVPWWLHDFRRTGVTTMARLGVPETVADRILNHVKGGNRGVMWVYQRHEYDKERRAAMELWAAHVLKVAAIEAPGEAET